MIKIIFAFVVFLPNLVWAYSNLYTSETNPASVTATLTVPCADAYKIFEDKVQTYFDRVPFVGKVTMVSASPWAETSKSNNSQSLAKKLHYSVASTVLKEFPLTIFPMKVNRVNCNANTPTTECTSTWTINIDGSATVNYQKTVLMQKSQNVWKSFNLDIYLTQAEAGTCSFTSSFYIKDSGYLWAKKHLLGSTPPELVEKSILKNFVVWGKNILPKLEGAQ